MITLPFKKVDYKIAVVEKPGYSYSYKKRLQLAVLDRSKIEGRR